MAWCGIIGHKCQLFALFVAYIEPPECLSPIACGLPLCQFLPYGRGGFLSYGMALLRFWHNICTMICVGCPDGRLAVDKINNK